MLLVLIYQSYHISAVVLTRGEVCCWFSSTRPAIFLQWSSLEVRCVGSHLPDLPYFSSGPSMSEWFGGYHCLDRLGGLVFPLDAKYDLKA